MQKKLNNDSPFPLTRMAHSRRKGQPTNVHPSLNIKLRLILVCCCLSITGGRAWAQQTQAADAVLPAGMSLNWEQVNVQTVNAKRSQALLNGTWRFAPAVEGASQPPQVGWGYIRVPGSWAAGGGGRRRGGGRSRRRGGDIALLARGTGPQWQNY